MVVVFLLTKTINALILTLPLTSTSWFRKFPIAKLWQFYKIFHLYSFWKVELPTDASGDISVDCRLTYRSLYWWSVRWSSLGGSSVERELVATLHQSTVGRWLVVTSPTDHRHLVDLTGDTSVDFRSTWLSIYRPISTNPSPTHHQHSTDVATHMWPTVDWDISRYIGRQPL